MLVGRPVSLGPGGGRLLRPGGALIFLVNSALLTLCMPEEDDLAASDRLLRPAFGMYRIEWPERYGCRVPPVPRRLAPIAPAQRVRANLIEVQAPEAGTTRYPYVTLEWARQWPSEEIWKARRRADDATRLGPA